MASVAIALGVLAAACSTTSGGQAGKQHALAARYTAIATVGNRGLEVLDDLSDRDRDDLAAARTDLRDAAATERRFDRSLLAIDFPSAIEATARALVTVNESRATVTSQAAASTSLEQLHGYEQPLAAANSRVEAQVRTIRKQLGLPPPDTS